MRRHTVVTTMECDMHKDGTEAVASFAITLDEGTRQRTSMRVVDVCEEHAAQLRALTTVLRTVPRVVEERTQPPPYSETGTCPKCAAVITNRNLSTHLADVHKLARIEQPKECPDCTKAIPAQVGMIKHRKSMHGYDYIADIVAQGVTPKRKRR